MVGAGLGLGEMWLTVILVGRVMLTWGCREETEKIERGESSRRAFVGILK